MGDGAEGLAEEVEEAEEDGRDEEFAGVLCVDTEEPDPKDLQAVTRAGELDCGGIHASWDACGNG